MSREHPKQEPKQLGFVLNSSDPLSKRYLVVHSGISNSVSYIKTAIKTLKENSEKLIIISIVGAQGSGKSHILNYAKFEAEQNQVEFKAYDDLDIDTDNLSDKNSDFISTYEKFKITGGLIVVSFNEEFNDFDPHLKTRLVHAQSFRLDKPREEEYRQILISVMQRDNINLSEKSINYILSRVPANTLSLKSLSDKLKQMCEQHDKSAKFFTIRDAIKES